MNALPTGWSEVQIAGHACEIYEPPTVHPQGYAVMYLHGVHLNHLHDKPVFVDLLARNGLRAQVVQQVEAFSNAPVEQDDADLGPPAHALFQESHGRGRSRREGDLSAGPRCTGSDVGVTRVANHRVALDELLDASLERPFRLETGG